MRSGRLFVIFRSWPERPSSPTWPSPEAERIGKYMTRPVLSLESLSLLEREAEVGSRWGEDGGERDWSRA